MTQRSTTAAVVSALSPICVDKFQRSAEAGANMAELKKVSSYQQGLVHRKGRMGNPAWQRAGQLVGRASLRQHAQQPEIARAAPVPWIGAEHAIMALMFPNPSRSYDATRRAVRFWGHDSAMEWSFFVTEDALKSVNPAMVQDEAGMLGAFDSHRERVWAAAAGPIRVGARDPTSSARRTFDRPPMNTRTRHKTWTFGKPFLLKGVDRLLPAGDYRVTTDEELIEGLSFPAYRRVATMIFVPGQTHRTSVEMVGIDPLDLQAAHDKDAAGMDLAAARSGHAQ